MRAHDPRLGSYCLYGCGEAAADASQALQLVLNVILIVDVVSGQDNLDTKLKRK